MRVFATRHSDWLTTVGDFPAMSQRLVIVTGSGGVQNSEPSKVGRCIFALFLIFHLSPRLKNVTTGRFSVCPCFGVAGWLYKRKVGKGMPATSHVSLGLVS